MTLEGTHQLTLQGGVLGAEFLLQALGLTLTVVVLRP